MSLGSGLVAAVLAGSGGSRPCRRPSAWAEGQGGSRSRRPTTAGPSGCAARVTTPGTATDAQGGRVTQTIIRVYAIG